MTKTVALALGSGGARGYAHIGAIQVLQERGHEIAAVSGASMGAVIGGLHAAGALPEFTEWARTLTQRDVLRLLDPAPLGPGAFHGTKIVALVAEMLGGVRIEGLPVPYTAVATDLVARRSVWFQHGPLADALRASIALPGVFTPVMIDGRLLADGGILDAVPLAPLASVRADLVLAVSLGGDRTGGRRDPEPASTVFDGVRRPAEELVERVRRAVARVRPPDPHEVDAARSEAVGPAPFGSLPHGLRTMDVMYLSIEAMQDSLTRYRLAGHPPDLLVEMPQDACGTLDFHLADEMIELGRRYTEAALDRSGL